jgi:subtilase family serine protease
MRSRGLGRRLTVLAVVLGVATAIATTTVGAAVRNVGQDRQLLQTRPAWAAGATQLGPLASGQSVTAKVWLAPRDRSGLAALAAAVSNPNSAKYGQFITHKQYAKEFAPTRHDVAAVKRWLTKAGLQVTKTGPDGHYLAVSGTSDAIAAAFGTQIATYTVNGQTTQAPTSDLSIPSSLAGLVLGVTGLAQFGHQVKPADFGPPGGFANAPPCSEFYGQKVADDQPPFMGETLAYAPCGYTPAQFRSLYGETTNGVHRGDNLGAGATVAITDAFDSPRLESDAKTYAANRGEPFKSGKFVDKSVPEDASKGDDCGGNGWYGEQNLDVEAVHGMAPAARVLYYGAASCYDDDLLAQLAQIDSDNKASIVTNSWGEPTFVLVGGVPVETIDQATIDAYESVFQQGAVQGIGFYFSSGDNGDELAAFGYKHPDWPTGDPWVTSVGGSSLGIDANGARSFETGWGTQRYTLVGDQWQLTSDFLYGAGGGYSEIFPEPAYQVGVVGDDPTGGRAVPDVGLDGDPNTGMLIGITQDFDLPSVCGPAGVHYCEYRIGGTSLSSPLFAGLQAVAQGRSRIGFANPLIYSLAGSGVYYDVTPQGPLGDVRVDFVNGENADDGLRTSVRTFDHDSSLVTGPGWDDVTGVGAPTTQYIKAVQAHNHGG